MNDLVEAKPVVPPTRVARTTAGSGHERPDGGKLLLSIGEACNALGIGRTTVYGLLGNGALRSVKIGRRNLIPTSALLNLVEHGAPDE